MLENSWHKKEKPLFGLTGLGGGVGSNLVGGGGGDPVYVDDVFSVDLWEGTGSAQTITNGIDLDGEGGLVWSKNRGSSVSHLLNDSARGIESGSYYSELVSDTDGINAKYTPWGATAFNSNGFSLGGSNSQFNLNGDDYVSWTFRKAPGFFDVVTYTGNDTAGRTISHNLGSAPGMIIVKDLDATNWWICYHRSMGNTKGMYLNDNGAESDQLFWNDTDPTSTEFTVGIITNNNANGHDYVAYIFAHDDQSFGAGGNESIIKCDHYWGNSTAGKAINLGFEPQFLLLKSTSYRNWFIWRDSNKALFPDLNISEVNYGDAMAFTSTGFTVSSGGDTNTSGEKYTYMAIAAP